jgi:hypothetical protein
MQMAQLRKLLERAERLLRANRADHSADTLKQVDAVLETSSAASVSDFVATASAKISEPDLSEQSVAVIADRLRALRSDRSGFLRIQDELSAKTFPLEKLYAVAGEYTGMRKQKFSSRAAALKAIKAFFDERAYLSEKAAAGARVTPF